MSKTTNAIVTVNTNAIATINNDVTSVTPNAKKVNNVLTLDEVKKLFVACGITPKYTDSINYVGCGTRCNSFSVNVKKTKYNIYCSDTEYDIVSKLKLSDTIFISGGNKVDKTRPNYIECKSTDSLKKMLQVILKNNDKIALAK